jgi:hypothetical protein
MEGAYTAAMADNAAVPFVTGALLRQGRTGLANRLILMADVLGSACHSAEAPEGWIKKIERRREGKLWVGFFHVRTTDANGGRIRQKKEKTLGPASLPKHEAQRQLADYIREYTGRLNRQDDSISTFSELWTPVIYENWN